MVTLANWQAAADRLGLRRSGHELVGPCPACGDGQDRFRVTRRGGVFCRQCCPDGSDPAAIRRLITAAGFHRPDPDWRPPPRRRPALSIDNPARSARPARLDQAAQLWAAAIPDPGPIGRYLAGRGCWPPGEAIPDSVRWLTLGKIAAAIRWRDPPPANAAGVMVCNYRDGADAIRAVSLEALTADGARPAWRWRRTIGTRSGAAFRAAGPGDALAIAEGECDALAIRTWTGGEAWACGGSAGMAALAPLLAATGRPITIHCDGDTAGEKAASTLQDDAHARGASVRLVYAPPGYDPADALAEAWAERAAIMEADAGMTRSDAERDAWRSLWSNPDGS